MEVDSEPQLKGRMTRQTKCPVALIADSDEAHAGVNELLEGGYRMRVWGGAHHADAMQHLDQERDTSGPMMPVQRPSHRPDYLRSLPFSRVRKDSLRGSPSAICHQAGPSPMR